LLENKNGGKFMKGIKKLYRGYSVVDNSNGNDGIGVTWYNADIKMSAVNYEDIIKDYTRMPSEEKMTAIKYVDEFFTSDQIELLGKFVKEEFGTKLLVEEFNFPIEVQEINGDNDEVINLGFSEVEGREGVNIIQLNKLETYDLSFKVNGFYLQDDSKSNEILEKLKTDYTSHNGMANQIVPENQLDDETIHRLFEAVVVGRVRFVTAGSLGDLDIKNLGKVTIH